MGIRHKDHVAEVGMNTQANEIAIVNDIADSLRGEMDGKTGLKRAINNLIEKGLIEKDQWLRGKAYRADYDAVLMPVLEPSCTHGKCSTRFNINCTREGGQLQDVRRQGGSKQHS